MKKQWFPIQVKTSQHYAFGRWYYRTYKVGQKEKTGQVFAIGKLRIVLGN